MSTRVGEETVKAILLGLPDSDLNAFGSDGMTALMQLASRGYVLYVETLLGRSAIDVNLASEADGFTALHLAAMWNTPRQVFEAILKHPDTEADKKDAAGR